MGQKVAELRKNHNFTQKELAEKIGMSVSSISRVENNHELLYTDKMVLMCELFGITPNELLGINERA